MSNSDATSLIAEIAARTEIAIELASRRLESESDRWRYNCYRLLATNLAAYKKSFLEGRLGAPGGGAGWGAGKALSDWDLNDHEMSAAVNAAETLFRDGR
jgi:hypothetical protein